MEVFISLLNNAYKRTFEASAHIKTSALLPDLEFHSDNGSEFINNAAEIWCKDNSVPFTTSCGRKKNGAAVREHAGCDRLRQRPAQSNRIIT